MTAEGGISQTKERRGFYTRTLGTLLDEGILHRDMRVLVVCGGLADRDAFRELGFEDVTISNLAGEGAPDVSPYRWAIEDAEHLSCEDESYDLVAVSAGLHHCRSPHRALLEMVRVARSAAFVLESRDSLLMRFAVRLGAIDEYELTAVAAHNFRSGGVNDTSTPNYVYRWTEREVLKTIRSYAPHVRPRVRFFHELELPLSVLAARHGRLGEAAGQVGEPALRLLSRVFPSQANLFAFVVAKPTLPGDLQEWMRLEAGDPLPDETWIRGRLAMLGEGRE